MQLKAAAVQQPALKERLENKIGLIILVIITWPEKFDFVLVPEYDITGILT